MVMAVSVPRYTIADLERFPDDGNRYESVGGGAALARAVARARRRHSTRWGLRGAL